MKKILTIGAMAVLSVACVFGATGCSSSNNDGPLKTDTGLTGTVAATVNGVEIPEDKITRSINNLRLNYGYEEDDKFAEYLNMTGETPSSLRDNYLETLIDQELIRQFAGDEGCAATDEEIQEQVDKVRANYSSDEAWNEALSGSGYADEQAYRDDLKYSIGEKKLKDHFAEQSEVSEEALLEEAQSQLNGKGTMRKSSHILFKADDQATALDVLSKLQSGELDFAEAAQTYSTDTGSAADGGNVGWDGMTSFVEEYQTALDGLSVGQMTELVESEYGYHIIKCTDMVTLPDEITTTAGIPDDIMADIRTSASESSSDDALKEWTDGKQESSEVVINDMPENLPYDVDMSKYESSAQEEATDEAADEQLESDVTETANDVDTAEADAETQDGTAGAESTEGADASASEGEGGSDAHSEGAEGGAEGQSN